MTKNEQTYQKKRGSDPVPQTMYEFLKKALNFFYPKEQYPVILEIGCGAGTTQQYIPDRELIGIDLCPEHLELAQNEFPENNFILADLFHSCSKSRFKPESFHYRFFIIQLTT